VHELQLQYLSLWYTSGTDYGFYDGEWKVRGGIRSADSVIIASEPLTRDVSTWLEVQPYSLIYVERKEGKPKVKSVELDA
jgi:glutamine amidotransferase